MPSMTTYSSYETLTLFQSIAKYGTDASTFQDISTALIKNEFIPQNGEQNAERLSASALRNLYETVIEQEKNGDTIEVNGNAHDRERSPKRRKLSASPQATYEDNQNDSQIVQDLVDTLYNRYKEQVIKEIRREEEVYARLQDDIKSLESKVEAFESETAQTSASGSVDQSGQEGEKAFPKVANVSSNVSEGSVANAGGSGIERIQHIASHTNSTQKSVFRDAPPSLVITSSNGQPGQASNTSQQDSSLAPALTKHSSNGSNAPTPSRSPVSKGNGVVQGISTPSKGHDSPESTKSPMPTAQGRPPVRQPIPYEQGVQVHSQPNAYPPYAQYPHQWHPQMVHAQYAQHATYGTPPYYPQPVPGRHPQTPHQPLYAPYPQTAPMQYGPPHNWQGQAASQYPASTATTPISRPASRASVTKSGTTTPWRKKHETAATARPVSPKRPDRAISPLEVSAASIKHEAKKESGRQIKGSDGDTPVPSVRTSRRGRPSSKTPSAMGPSRSQSAASRGSEFANERSGLSRLDEGIKVEPPSTPLPPPSDSESQRLPGRRGRPRNSTLTSHGETGRGATAKRKRETQSPSPSVQSTTATAIRMQKEKQHISSLAHDPSLVIVSKNFSRTSQLLLNEITSHKLAGIFAKPLSERDAPGYKDLIHRPQDLKAIKAAISKGNRAALAAIEAIEPEEENDDSTQDTALNSHTTPGAIGNGFYLVTKTSDLIPPKGIVNGSQLEMELMRMFANAIMFNPLPSSERGFGRHLKLRKNGGDVDPNRSHLPDLQEEDSEDDQNSEDSDSTVVGGTGWDEGGIIADTREMFDDVNAAVDKWRGLEDERMAASGQNPDGPRAGSMATPSAMGTYLDISAARHASVSASSNIADDEGDGGSTPVPSSVAGTTRKRRRIAEQ